MKLKKIKKLRINSKIFTIDWNYDNGGAFNYADLTIKLDSSLPDDVLFEVLCHELMELALVELHVRLDRPDVMDDYIFVYDHRQFTAAMSMFAGLITQFIRS